MQTISDQLTARHDCDVSARPLTHIFAAASPHTTYHYICAGVTKEEKLKRAVEFFHEKREPFAMKELQAKLSKEKGIVQQSVEGVYTE